MIDAVEDVEEESEIARSRWETGSRPSRNGIQRRIDRFTRERHRLREEKAALARIVEDLQADNAELKAALRRALNVVDKCRSHARVGVGITITHDPLHGSGRAAFPHPALALGNNAHAA
jgi:predicted RNase H-like nuclease (RuvC/YqgF family)